MTTRVAASFAAMVLAAVLLILPQAWAHQCPSLMAEIDGLLTEASVGDDVLEEVRALRAEGERLHQDGGHDESVAVLQQAIDLLNAD